jgi:potassium efflux system protein
LALLSAPAVAQTPPPSKQELPAVKEARPPPAPAEEKLDDAADAPSAAERALARTKSKIEEIEGRSDIPPAIRDQALTLYRSALGQLEAAAASDAAATRFQAASQRAPKRAAEAKQQLDALRKSDLEPEFAKRVERLSLAEAEQALDKARAEGSTLKTDLGQLEARLRDMSTRATAAREEQSAEKQELDALENPDMPLSGEQVPIVVDAKRAALTAERRARTAKVNLLEQELISLPARQASAAARRDLVAAKIERLTEQLPLIEVRVNALRQSEAAKRQQEAEGEARKLSGQHPALEAYAKETEALRQQITEMTRLLDDEKARLAQIKSETARVRDSRTAAQQVLEIGSIGGEFGEFLRVMRAQLPSVSAVQKRILDREQAIVDARLNRLRVDETRRGLTDAGNVAKQVLANGGKQGEPPLSSELRATLEKLIVARRDALAQLQDVYGKRIAQLAELNASERELLNQTSQLRALLSSRLLWLPSSAPIGGGWLAQVSSSLKWFFDPAAWKETLSALARRAAGFAPLTIVVVLVCGALVYFRGALRQRLGTIAAALGRYSTDNYWRTPEALLITVLLAATTPIVIGYAGWLLTRPPQPSEFAGAVGAGLVAATSILLFLRFAQLLCVENGVFSAHFGWPERPRCMLWRNIRRLKFIATPAAFVMGMIEVSNAQDVRDGLGRLAFLTGAIAVAVFIGRIASPRRGIFSERLAAKQTLWLTRGIWYPLLWLTPLAIAALALSGYYDAASQIQHGLILSIAIAAGAFLVYSMAMRHVLVTRRRLEITRAYERRKELRAQMAAQTTAEGEAELPAAALEEPEVDIASISDQTRKLVRLVTVLLLATCLWFFWREAIPSIALLDIPLWTQTLLVDGTPRSVPIKVSNLMIALAIAAITFIAVRNLPGLLEMAALQRLKIDAGTRYAFAAVSRYLIATIGLIFVFQYIGFDWSQVQWIVAALGVGVGFGLQEIVANFISGLIILFERPVRVGDTVTIGNLTGTVSRIQIRATTMTDGDNREIIVPNKALITEKVINWTLSDTVTRLTFKVGVGHDSDAVLAQAAILQAVKATPHVLDTPSPRVIFIGFTATALEFEIRVFVSQLAHRVTVLNDLHVAIDLALRERAIVMA